MRRNLIGLLALACTLALLLYLLVQQRERIANRPLGDAVEYWAAAKLTLNGENPYDLERVTQLERQAGRPTEPVLMYNPPWTLPFVLPLGYLDPRTAQTVWQAIHLLILLLVSPLLGRLYGGEKGALSGWLATFTFVPAYVALALGQISPLMTLGITLFLLAQREGQDLWAGLACTLVSIKPQVGLLFWAALAWWILYQRRWKVLAGLALGIGLGLALAWAVNPGVLSYYRQVTAEHPPTHYASHTWGTWLRLLFGLEHFWLQFLPPTLGLLWVLTYAFLQRRTWDWVEHGPLVLLVSVASMAYGWFFDLVLALPALVQVACQRPLPTMALGGYAVLNLAILGLGVLDVSSPYYVPTATAFLLVYLLARASRQNLLP